MPQESFQERTEQATPKRRQEAREKGQVAKSRELASVAVLLSGLLTLFWGSGFFYHQTSNILKYYLAQAGSLEVSAGNVKGLAFLAVKQLGTTLGPLFIVLTVIAILSNYLQVGPLLSTEAIKPKLSKISPFEGLKRLFSAQAFMEFIKSLSKLIIVTWIAYSTMKGELDNLLPLLNKSPSQILYYLGDVSFTIFWRTCLVMIILAILDYLFQRWEHERNLRMTKQELKEEYKQTEGDPQVKARIKSLQREAARKRMMAEVPNADVVITNPTHLAVALKYDNSSMDAPTVVAKGAGHVAEKIKSVAMENGVPVIENKPLAQNLFKLVEIGKAIPENLYQAVAEVLAYVYRLKGKMGARNQGGVR